MADIQGDPTKPGWSYSGPAVDWDKVLNPSRASTVTPPKTSALNTSALFANSPDSTALAAGFPMLSQMIDYMLRTQSQIASERLQGQASARADRQQSIDLARLMADLERVAEV